MNDRQPKPKHQAIWEKHFNDYIQWMNEHNGMLPRRETKDAHERELCDWMRNSRTRYNKGLMEQCRIEKFAPIMDVLTGTKTNASILEEQFNSKNSKENIDNSLFYKGLTKKIIEKLNKNGIYSVTDVVAALRELHTLNNSYGEYMHIEEAKEKRLNTLENVLNIGRNLIPLYSYDLILAVFKRITPNIEIGDILLMRSIIGMEVQGLFFTKEIIFSGLHERLDKALSTLTPREEKMLRLRYYGDGNKRVLTYREIAEQFSKNAKYGSYVKTVIEAALRKLRHPHRYKYIAGFRDKID